MVLFAGLGSSWHFIRYGAPFTTETIGPWVTWPAAGLRNGDPYTRARVNRYGILPLSGRIAATFEARFDSGGGRLHSSCEYTIRSQPIKASWWSIAVFDGGGLLIPNPAKRYGFDSSTIILRPDGSFVISLAREARAGNWLPVGGAGRLTLVLTLLQPERDDPEISSGSAGVAKSGFELPDIQKVKCR